MSQQWWPTNPKIFFPWLLHFVLVLNALVRKSSDLHEFNQTHNAAVFSPKFETFALQIQYITWPHLALLHILFVLKTKLGTFCQFTVVHFDLISNIFLCRCASRTLRMQLLTWCRVISLAGLFGSGRTGLGLEFVKIFRANFGPAYKTFYNIKSNDFFFRDVDLLCSPR